MLRGVQVYGRAAATAFLHVGVAAAAKKSESCPSVDISVELFALHILCRDFWRNFAVDNKLPTGFLGGRLHLDCNLNPSYFVHNLALLLVVCN